MHQYTGRKPLYTKPRSKNVYKVSSTTDSYSGVMVEYGRSNLPNTPIRLNCSRCKSRYFSAYFRHAWRTASGGILSFFLPNVVSTLISIGNPWQSHPGT